MDNLTHPGNTDKWRVHSNPYCTNLGSTIVHDVLPDPVLQDFMDVKEVDDNHETSLTYVEDPLSPPTPLGLPLHETIDISTQINYDWKL